MVIKSGGYCVWKIVTVFQKQQQNSAFKHLNDLIILLLLDPECC